MSLKNLNQFLVFNLEEFLREKNLLFVKALQWTETNDKTGQARVLGSKVVVQIWEDNTPYAKPDTNNFGEQLTIKVRDLAPSAFEKWKPLSTEVFVTSVERASLYGDHRNQLSIIASVSTKAAQ